MPGVEVTLARSDAPEPTNCRMVDNPETFSKQLRGTGVAFDIPCRTIESIGLSVAFLTDPWGTYIRPT